MGIFLGVVIVCIFIALLGYKNNSVNSVSLMNERIAMKHALEGELVLLLSEYQNADYPHSKNLKIKIVHLVHQLKQIEVYRTTG